MASSANLLAVVWCALGLTAVPLGQWLGPWLRSTLGERAEDILMWAPWLHGLLPMLLAWISGAVPARFLGLLGPPGWLAWLGSALLAAALWWAASWFVSRQNLQVPGYPLDWAVLDEPRWALYRAAGWLWAMDRGLGLLIGLGLALLEWALRHRLWRGENRATPATCLSLARIASSTLIFSLTGNLWVTIAFQVGVLRSLAAQPNNEEAV